MARLGDIGAVITGNTPKTSDNRNYDSNDICFIKPSDINDNELTDLYSSEYYISEYARSKARILPAQSVLVTCIGIVGKIGINSLECAFNQQINAIIPDDQKCNYRYLAYALQYKKPMLQNIANAPVVPILNKSQFSDIEIPLPPLAEQCKIATVLDKVSGLIAKRRQQLDKLNELVKSRFIELFGTCVERKCLEEYALLITKGASPKWQGVDYCEEGVLFVTSENVRGGYLDFSKRKYLDGKINEIQPRSILKRNDILINIVGASIGRAAVYNYDEIANINQAVALVRVDYSRINQTYLMTFLNSAQALEMYGKMKKGGARDNLSLQNIADLQIPVASMELQNQFAAFVEQTDKSKLAIQKSLDKLEILKKALMQKYFG